MEVQLQWGNLLLHLLQFQLRQVQVILVKTLRAQHFHTLIIM